MVECDPAAELKAENARLIALLEANGIQWRASPEPMPSLVRELMEEDYDVQDQIGNS